MIRGDITGNRQTPPEQLSNDQYDITVIVNLLQESKEIQDAIREEFESYHRDWEAHRDETTGRRVPAGFRNMTEYHQATARADQKSQQFNQRANEESEMRVASRLKKDEQRASDEKTKKTQRSLFDTIKGTGSNIKNGLSGAMASGVGDKLVNGVANAINNPMQFFGNLATKAVAAPINMAQKLGGILTSKGPSKETKSDQTSRREIQRVSDEVKQVFPVPKIMASVEANTKQIPETQKEVAMKITEKLNSINSAITSGVEADSQFQNSLLEEMAFPMEAPQEAEAQEEDGTGRMLQGITSAITRGFELVAKVQHGTQTEDENPVFRRPQNTPFGRFFRRLLGDSNENQSRNPPWMMILKGLVIGLGLVIAIALAGAIGMLIPVLARIGHFIVDLGIALKPFFLRIVNVVVSLIEGLVPFIKQIAEILIGVFGGIAGTVVLIFQSLGRILQGSAGAIIRLINGAVDFFLDLRAPMLRLINVVVSLFERLAPLIVQVMQAFVAIFVRNKEAIASFFGSAVNLLTRVANSVGDIVSVIGTGLANTFGKIFEVINRLIPYVSDIAAVALGVVRSVLTSIGGVIKIIATEILTLVVLITDLPWLIQTSIQRALAWGERRREHREAQQARLADAKEYLGVGRGLYRSVLGRYAVGDAENERRRAHNAKIQARLDYLEGAQESDVASKDPALRQQIQDRVVYRVEQSAIMAGRVANAISSGFETGTATLSGSGYRHPSLDDISASIEAMSTRSGDVHVDNSSVNVFNSELNPFTSDGDLLFGIP